MIFAGSECLTMVASSATPQSLSEVHSRFVSLVRAALYHPAGRCTSRHRVKSGEPLYPPWPPSRCIYYPSIFRRTSRRRRGRGWRRSPFFLSRPCISSHSPLLPLGCSSRRGRIRQKREGSACWIAEPRGVGARIKGAVRLEGAPNYDVTDRTRRDQVSRIQNGLLITELPSLPLLRSPRWPSLTSACVSAILYAP